MSPAKICSTWRFVRLVTGLLAFTMTPMPSGARIVGFIFTPFACAAETSVVLARRDAMPIWAVLSMMAVIPVVEPSAAISKETPGWFALYSSASCGTSLAPRVSEPLMTSFCAEATEAIASAARRRRDVFMVDFLRGLSWLEFHHEINEQLLRTIEISEGERHAL